MTATERAKRSDALYYETFSVTRRVLCDMIANREADLDDLREENERLIVKLNAEHLVRQNVEAENATLRQQLADATESMGRVEERCAKLRELVEDMLDCIDIQIAFERVPARWMQDEFAGRARELGIEAG